MKLFDLLEGIVPQVPPRCNPEVAELCFDSRKVGQGSCFVAQVGVQVDGHRYIASAVEKGAVAVVCQKLPAQTDERVAYVVVENSDVALGIWPTIITAILHSICGWWASPAPMAKPLR